LFTNTKFKKEKTIKFVSMDTQVLTISAISSILVFVIFVLTCITLARVGTIKNDVKVLKTSGVSDWFKIVNVNFELNSASQIIKTFIVPENSYLINTNSLLAYTNVTFGSTTTLRFKAATTLALLDSGSPDLFDDDIEIFDGISLQTSGTAISSYNQTGVNIETEPLMEQQTVYVSLKLSQAPLTGGTLKIAFVGNYVNVASFF